MSRSRNSHTEVLSIPVAEFQYRPIVSETTEVKPVPREEPREPDVRLTQEVLLKRLAAERSLGVAEAEASLRREYEQRAHAETARISKVIDEFDQSRRQYFSRVETEVVHLALAIAAKILHREAKADPILVAAIVQIALGQLKEGSLATIRVRPEGAPRWREHFASQTLKLVVSVVEDPELKPADCFLETELGTVNFSLDVQLKEVEQGFFDVLAQKPQI